MGIFGLSKLSSYLYEQKTTKDPIAAILQQEKTAPLLTVILFDMEKSGFLFSKKYRHQYRIVSMLGDSVVAKQSQWYDVPSTYFAQHESDLGLELAAIDSAGKTYRVVTPPGYTNYIGNAKFGVWSNTATLLPISNQEIIPATDSTPAQSVRKMEYFYNQNNDGNDFWVFYPNYEYVKPILQIPTGKIVQKDHNTARRYHTSGIVYYGVLNSVGGRRYGTNSTQYNNYRTGKSWSRGGGGSGK